MDTNNSLQQTSERHNRTLTIIGHTVGAYIAAEFAALSPERTTSLRLLYSAPMNLPRSWHLFLGFCDVRKSGPEGLWLRCLFPWLFHHSFFDNPAQIEGAVAGSLAYPHAQSLEAMQRQLNALKQFDPSDLIHRIKVPTLALLAQSDLIVPHNEALEMLLQRFCRKFFCLSRLCVMGQ